MTKYFLNPFATSGDKEAVPDTPGASTLVNYEEGYTPEYELDPDTDPNGNYVGRQRMNQLFFDITENLKFLQDSSYPEFVVDDGTGSPVAYPINAIVRFSGINYIAIVDGTTTTDPSSSSEFIPWHLGITAFVGSNTAIDTNIDKTTLQDYNDGAGSAYFDTIINAGGADESFHRWIRKTSGSTSTIKLGELTNPDNVEGNSVLSILGNIFSGSAGDQKVPNISDFSAFITNSGYQSLPGGLIIQWGRPTASTSGTSVSFPIVFPNAVFAVIAGNANSSPGFASTQIVSASNVSSSETTTSGFYMYSSSGSPTTTYIAIGY